MSDTIYKPLTPDMRNQINNSIENNIGELNMCKSNIYVNMQKAGYVALKNIINALPDVYPIPFTRK